MNFVVQYVIVNILEKQIKILAPVFKSVVVQTINHLLECEHFNYALNLHSLPPSDNSVEYLDHAKIAVYDSTKIIDNSQNWIELCFLESLHMKWKKPKLNCGIKATKELVLFS